jgi:hypothetical protein
MASPGGTAAAATAAASASAHHVLVTGMGPSAYVLSIVEGGDDVSVSVAPAAVGEPTPWAALVGGGGGDARHVVLLQRRASDRASCARLAVLAGDGGASAPQLLPRDDAADGSAVVLGGPDPVHAAVDPHSGALLVGAHGDGLRAVRLERGGPGGGGGASSSSSPGLRFAGPPVTVPVGGKCSQALWHPRLPGVLYVTHLAGHALLRYAVDAASATFTLAATTPLPPGSGPRRVLLDDGGSGGGAVTRGWVINELGATVSALAVDPVTGDLAVTSSVSSLPPGGPPPGAVTSSQLALVGGGGGGGSEPPLLLAGNRSDCGHDSVALLRVGSSGGDLAPLGWATPATAAADLAAAGMAAPAGQPGDALRVPRDMAVVARAGGGGRGALVAVACQPADAVTLFRVVVDEGSGDGGASSPTPRLRAVAHVRLPPGAQPTCLVPLTA